MGKDIKINFILPYKPKRPTGGVKMMYEYANRLAKKNYSVHIYYPLKTRFIDYRFPFIIRWILSKIEGFRTFCWFDFEPTIKMSYVNAISDKNISDADATISTWWSTALDMGRLNPSKGKKINLIQGFENWAGHEDLLYTSYQIEGATNVVIANFLKEIVEEHSRNRTVIIENAIDLEVFGVRQSIESRDPYTVCMNYSTQGIKGSNYGIEALKIVKNQKPDLKVEMFSIYARPEGLPEWISFYQTPADLPEVYNRSAIFITNSFTEGFGLVSVEAMACGCALICTDIPGHKEFATDGVTALLVEPQNSAQMAEKIGSLIDDNVKRIAIAKQGNNYVQKYSWDSAINKMESVINEAIKE